MIHLIMKSLQVQKLCATETRHTERQSTEIHDENDIALRLIPVKRLSLVVADKTINNQ